MIELIYFTAKLQCAASTQLVDVKVDVYQNQQLVQTMSISDKLLLDVDSINDLTFEYRPNASCFNATPTEKLLGPNDSLPNLTGAFQQQSIQDMQEDLASYEELWLVELGVENPNGSYFDLQDVVLKVNNNPTVATLFAD